MHMHQNYGITRIHTLKRILQHGVFVNSENLILNNVFKFALNNRRSVLGKNFRCLAFKYKINAVHGIHIGQNSYQHSVLCTLRILY